jgi:hypothetical protein
MLNLFQSAVSNSTQHTHGNAAPASLKTVSTGNTVNAKESP